MKSKILASYTILRTFEIDEDLTDEDIDALIKKDLIEMGIFHEVNDIEWDKYIEEE